MNPGKVSSKATFCFCVSIFLPGISLAGLICLVQVVSHCPPQSCPTRWRPRPDPQNAIQQLYPYEKQRNSSVRAELAL